MSIQSKILVCALLLTVIIWIVRNFAMGRLASGQAVFWLTLLLGGTVLTVFPALVDQVSLLWGDLLPVSWISLVGIVFLIVYLLKQSVTTNALESRLAELTRAVTFLEERLRRAEPGREDASGAR